MAKRKRLSPLPVLEPMAAPAPETKALKNGWAGTRAAPIADVAGSAAAQAALEEVAGEMASARRDGRLVQRIALEAIDESHLVRDRAVVDADDMAALKASLAARGQQTPLEVVDLGQGRFGLISGWRRLMALRSLGEATALCLLRAPQSAAEAYQAMVEENEIRANLSYYERARIAARAAEQGAYPTARRAVKGLFAHVSAPKRSKIVSFLGIYEALDAVLAFPAALSERQGLALAKALEADAGLADRLTAALADPATDAAAEQAVLSEMLRPSAAAPVAAQKGPRSKTAQNAAQAGDGVRITRGKQKLALSGPGVTEELLDALEAWLAEHL